MNAATAQQAMHKYLVIYTHRHGSDSFAFDSERTLKPRVWEFMPEGEDTLLDGICDLLNLRFESGETLELLFMPPSAGTLA